MPEVPDFKLTGKVILVISPQEWGKMFVSKHHYAIELAGRGNDVYFLNPPSSSVGFDVSFTQLKEYPGLTIIDHQLWFPVNLKFHAISVFHFLMSFHIRRVLKNLPKKPDIIWSFDLGNFYPFNLFPNKSLRIFHPVDEPLNKTAFDSGEGADLVLSVTNEILSKYAFINCPKFFIQHGVSASFLDVKVKSSVGKPIRVGFSGNLLRRDIDRLTLLRLIKENSDLVFDFWGSVKVSFSNLGGDMGKETRMFIEELQNQPNVVLHGPVSAKELELGLASVDMLLICYDISKDQSGGTNYHKVMEYLAIGKVIVSNNITTYAGRDDLITMCKSRKNNDELPGLFKKVVNSLEYYNSTLMVEGRRSYAAENTYRKQVQRIEELLGNIKIRI
ncbi:hypothetical protein KJS94_16550 [Flavihumibacter rivuli]|uniref:hypothetical protein n=1 Tax=Flavihumibacter rivuli TaxID=2838156 RepID=UPI001BDE2AC2|nr:hypothetical protein [Flavihumibacter rivuli]ULQ56261.1 hypothetical protein KJS94_16550 [Flavihumibacter rivuli]